MASADFSVRVTYRKRDYARAFALDLYPWLIRAIGCMMVAGSLVFGSIAGFTAAAKSFGVKKECRK